LIAAGALLGTLALVVGLTPGADEDPDLSLLPPVVHEAPAPLRSPPRSSSAGPVRVYLEEACSVASGLRALVVPYPSDAPAWHERLSLDASGRWAVARSLALAVNARLNLLAQDGADVWSEDSLQTDLREAYMTWEAHDGVFVEVGRVNVRNGVALGFNPTDFFRTGSLVGQVSSDPSVARQNRLGAVMVRMQGNWDGRSASVSYSPKLYGAPGGATMDGGVADLRMDATNSEHHLLATLDLEVADLSPQILASLEPERARIGISLSRQLGDSVVVYGEWAGGVDSTLLARAVEHGRATGVLPSDGEPLPASSDQYFLNDLAVGASWANAAARLTLNLEYHLHQGGFSSVDWRRWFDAGTSGTVTSDALWYVRGYANDRLEPVTSQAAFVRLAWREAFVHDLDLSGIAFVDLLDGSTPIQLSASYDLARSWILAAHLSANIGNSRSEWGSMPRAFSGSIQLTCYLW
jgi:hypothetical protein